MVRMGMPWRGGGPGGGIVFGGEVRARAPPSPSESLLLELSSLLEEELWESEELSPLLIWSMTRASAISSVDGEQQHCVELPNNHPLR